MQYDQGDGTCICGDCGFIYPSRCPTCPKSHMKLPLCLGCRDKYALEGESLCFECQKSERK